MKYFFGILFNFLFVGKKQINNWQVSFLHFFENSVDIILKEFLSMIIKTLGGVVLTAIIIFSFIQIGKIIKTLTSQYEHGTILEFAIFTCIMLASSIALYFMFNQKKTYQNSIEIPKKMNGQNLATLFLNGFAQGIENGKLATTQKKFLKVLKF